MCEPRDRDHRTRLAHHDFDARQRCVTANGRDRRQRCGRHDELFAACPEVKTREETSPMYVRSSSISTRLRSRARLRSSAPVGSSSSSRSTARARASAASRAHEPRPVCIRARSPCDRQWGERNARSVGENRPQRTGAARRRTDRDCRRRAQDSSGSEAGDVGPTRGPSNPTAAPHDFLHLNVDLARKPEEGLEPSAHALQERCSAN